jgi:Holliday junction DNA helicase RuvA
MIGQLRGILLEKQAPNLLLEVNGVGYELLAPLTSFYQLPDIGKEVTLYTHFVVREDSQSLFGFLHKRDRELFRALIKISGIGPKLALTILSGVDTDTFVHCVLNNDGSRLTGLPGIGKKTVQRLLMEMRDKLKDWETNASIIALTADHKPSEINDAINALISLGYKLNDASKAIEKYKDQNLSSAEMIKLALKDMGK